MYEYVGLARFLVKANHSLKISGGKTARNRAVEWELYRGTEGARKMGERERETEERSEVLPGGREDGDEERGREGGRRIGKGRRGARARGRWMLSQPSWSFVNFLVVHEDYMNYFGLISEKTLKKWHILLFSPPFPLLSKEHGHLCTTRSSLRSLPWFLSRSLFAEFRL